MIDTLLRAFSPREAEVLSLYFVHRYSTRLIAKHCGETPEVIRQVAGIALSKLRHPSSRHLLQSILDDPEVNFLDVAMIRNLTVDDLVTCMSCSRRFLPTSSVSDDGGRPRQYCSNACRQKAYRARKSRPQTTRH
ncbi:sigma factor-like helix-turn-helix DNA-binding protein [Nonomuraea sp. NPDC005650]|uniref:sigma factor-like helix-turn-helix DNA-binding protein n=1 Tax=Nonomuraea sp. NPDC005650 TaxID=3157045 RepID=UPI0033A732CC